MANRILPFVRKLGERQGLAFGKKERVVAEAAPAARSIENPALAYSLHLDDVLRPAHQRQHAPKTCPSALGRNAHELAQQALVVGAVARSRAGVAGGVKSGIAAESIDLEAGVVRQRGRAERLVHRERLRDRIVSVCGSGFGWKEHCGMSAERIDALGETTEQDGELAGLPRVPGREDDQVQTFGSCFRPSTLR